MSSRRNSFKNHSNISTNSTTATTTHNPNASTDTTEKSINLNEFLDFLNLSCHVNDMISQNTEEQHRQHKEHLSNSKTTATTGRGGNVQGTKNYGLAANTIDFQKLSQNSLVNELYGYNRKQPEDINDNGNAASTGDVSKPTRRSSITTTVTKSKPLNDGGLHPKLNEKLDYVLNEGILDAVLPFICPVPLPANYTSRLKPKQRDIKDQKINANTIVAVGAEDQLEVEGAVGKDNSSKIKGKTSVTQIKSSTVTNVMKKE